METELIKEVKELIKIVDIKPNQNLLGLVVVLVSLGIAEYYNLCALFWLSAVASFAFVVSNIFTLVAYTVNYWNKKMKKQQ